MTDLELLLQEVEIGWENGHTRHGVGGCLMVVMHRMIAKHGACDWAARTCAMTDALGFGTDLTALFHWNDEQTHVDAVIKRIATALYYPGHYAAAG